MGAITEKLKLNLNEENELGFKLSIEGTSRDVGNTKPIIRFVIEESETKQGWVYPAVSDENGQVTALLSTSEKVFSEKKKYSGRLEVILGSHYFVPTEVNLEFQKPLKVEASVITKGSSKRVQQETMMKEEERDTTPELSVKSAGSVTIQKKSAEKKQPTWESLTEEQKAKLIAQKKAQIRKKKLAEQKAKKTKDLAIKDKLKSMLADSLDLED